MTMTPLERKAAFRHAVTMNETTLDSAAQDVIGVSWHHLSQGIAGERRLSAEVQQKFATYIGRPIDEVFGDESTEATSDAAESAA